MQPSSTFFVQSLVAQLPLIAVYVVGLIVSMSRWERHPRVSSLTVTAMCICLGSIVLFTFFDAGTLIHQFVRALGVRVREPFILVAIFRSTLHAIGLGILLMAVFAQRQDSRQGFAVGPMGGQPPFAPPPIPRR